LSQDQLQKLLGEISEESPCGSRTLRKLNFLERKQTSLKDQLEASKDFYEHWLLDKKQLERLIEENDFNERLSALGHPSKILEGNIDLEKDDQRHAISELVVTLPQTTTRYDILHKVIHALHLYYKTYFEDRSPPPPFDEKAQKQLDEFNTDPERGASQNFQEFLAYKSWLSQNSKDEAWDGDIPDYAPILHADIIASHENLERRRELLENTVWNDAHGPLFENMFRQQSDQGMGIELIALMEKHGTLRYHFINQELKRKHQHPTVLNWLQDRKLQELVDMQKRAIEENLDQLLGMLTNIVGIDQPEFYHSLKQTPLQGEIFDKMVTSLSSSPAQRQYGMDQQHLHKVLHTQEELPKNLATVLQNGLPRGLENCRLKDSFDFILRLNSKVNALKSELESFSEAHRHGPEFAKIKLEYTDTETVRFILFTHIHDRLKMSKNSPKSLKSSTGMSPEELRDLLHQLYSFELTTGRNGNISGYIEHLYEVLPSLQSQPSSPTP
jgi:hypothetical protein